MSNFTEVKLWMKTAGQWAPARLDTGPPEWVYNLRRRLIEEEKGELFNAMTACDPVEIADGIADLLVVTYGTAVSYGINADAVFTEVMNSNFSKFENGAAVFDDGGKVLKGSDYRRPDIARVLEEGW